MQQKTELDRQSLGPVSSWLASLAPQSGQMRVLRALRNENRVHFYGDSRRRVRRNPTKVEILEVFNPADEKWRNAVLARGLEVLRQAAALAFSSD